MFSRRPFDLPTDIASILDQPAAQDVPGRIAQLEQQVRVMVQEHRRLMEAILRGFDALNGEGVLDIADAAIDASVNGIVLPSGIWTPTDGSGAVLALTVAWAKYLCSKATGLVWVGAKITYPATASGLGSQINGLPFAPADQGAGFCGSGGTATWVLLNTNSTMNPEPTGGGGLTNANLSGKTLWISATYRT